MAHLTRGERETIIRTSDASDEWIITTVSPVMTRRLSRIAEAWEGCERKIDSFGTVEFVLPMGAVSFRKPRTLTDEQRAANAANLEAARAAKSS